MAPAIVHFLVGAAVLLIALTPIALRYDVNREHAIWLIPVGGVWGLAPDVHHIAPVYADALYAIHNMPWMDLFGFHYTLDRPAVRARYNASVFGSIAAFVIAVAGFWSAGRVRRANPVARRPLEHAFVACLSAGLAGGIATAALWVVVSVQAAFPAVAVIAGQTGVLAGGLITLAAGGVLAGVLASVYELALPEPTRIDPPSTAVVGGLIGGGVWVVVVPVLVPLLLGRSVPLVHAGSLIALVVYGSVFGATYGMVRGAFSPQTPNPALLDMLRSD